MAIFTGTPGNDTITPDLVSAGVDALPPGSMPSADADNISGEGGDDVLSGDGGNDTIDGGTGDDTIDGGTGSDIIRGGSGDDLILGKTPGLNDPDDRDTIFGGAGNDEIFGNGGETDGYTLDGSDRIYGGAGDDKLLGKRGDDVLFGGGGNDRLGGYYGFDRLYGQGGDDRLIGRHDADRLNGGSGNDIYEYVSATDSTASARDIILNFDNVGAAFGDRISLLRIDADPSTGGNQAFDFVGTNATPGRGEVGVSPWGATNTMIRANLDGSPEPELEILVRDGSAEPGDWTAADFIL